jgi:hypothetical protein
MLNVNLHAVAAGLYRIESIFDISTFRLYDRCRVLRWRGD